MLMSGTLISFDGGTYRATVAPHKSRLARLKDIPVSRAQPAEEMTAGRRVLLWVAEEGESDAGALVIAVWE